MPLFRIQGGKTRQISTTSFRSEREVQMLIEGNLETIFGIRFLASEVSTDGGRIDTLGVDESNAPIVIEYKWGEQDEAIIQALSYLNWLVKNKWEVEQIIREKLGTGLRVEWGAPKVIVVAPSFSQRVKSAIEHLGENIELWTYTKYGDDILAIELFGASSSRVKTKRRVTNVKYEEASIGDHLERANKDTTALFEELQRAIFQLGDGIGEKPKVYYVGYWHNRIFCKVRFRKTKLRISIYTRGVHLDDPKKLAQPSSRHWEGSAEYHFFWLTKPEDVSYAVSLIKQSYRSTL